MTRVCSWGNRLVFLLYWWDFQNRYRKDSNWNQWNLIAITSVALKEGKKINSGDSINLFFIIYLFTNTTEQHGWFPIDSTVLIPDSTYFLSTITCWNYSKCSSQPFQFRSKVWAIFPLLIGLIHKWWWLFRGWMSKISDTLFKNYRKIHELAGRGFQKPRYSKWHH